MVGTMVLSVAITVVAGVTSSSAISDQCEQLRCRLPIDSECPCDGSLNHSRYRRCVSRLLRRQDAVQQDCRVEIAKCASRSVCGRQEQIVCVLGSPSDPEAPCTEVQSAERCEERGGTAVASRTSCCPECRRCEAVGESCQFDADCCLPAVCACPGFEPPPCSGAGAVLDATAGDDGTSISPRTFGGVCQLPPP